MGLKIEQKIEGYKKKIIIKKKIDLIGTSFLLIVFFIVFNPFYQAYLNNPNQFSSKDTHFLMFYIFIIIFFKLLNYPSRIFIIKDLSSGTIDLQKKILKSKSIIFHKDEKITLKLSKIFMLPLLISQKYILSLNSGDKSIILDPSITSQSFGTKGKRILSRRNTQWLFTKENAESISRFFDIPLLIEGEGVSQVKGQNFGQGLSVKNFLGLSANEAIGLIVWGLIGYFVGFIIFMLVLGIGTGLGSPIHISVIMGLIVFFITFILFARFGKRIAKKIKKR